MRKLPFFGCPPSAGHHRWINIFPDELYMRNSFNNFYSSSATKLQLWHLTRGVQGSADPSPYVEKLWTNTEMRNSSSELRKFIGSCKFWKWQPGGGGVAVSYPIKPNISGHFLLTHLDIALESNCNARTGRVRSLIQGWEITEPVGFSTGRIIPNFWLNYTLMCKIAYKNYFSVRVCPTNTF